MLKMHYFSNKFSKIANAESSPPLAPLNLRFLWPEVMAKLWFCGFKLIMTKSNFKKSVMTSFL